MIGRHASNRVADPALVLELLARELRGGASLPVALAAVAKEPETGMEMVVQRIRDGGSVGEELDRWCLTLPDEDQSLVRSVLRLGLSTGAGLAGSLDRVAATLREREEFALELMALSAQSRASAMLLAVAPIGFFAILVLVDASALAMLFTTPLGWACLVGGLLLDGFGFWWMSRLSQAVLA